MALEWNDEHFNLCRRGLPDSGDVDILISLKSAKQSSASFLKQLKTALYQEKLLIEGVLCNTYHLHECIRGIFANAYYRFDSWQETISRSV
jgi:hypothetical protein